MERLKQGGDLAQHLVCALDTYEAAFSAWAATPSLIDFNRVEKQLERVRVLRRLVPQVASEMAEVVTAHVNLSTMHIRDRTGVFGKQHSAADLATAQRRHSTAIGSLRVHCYHLLNGSGTAQEKRSLQRTPEHEGT
ncbi:MAG: hypothetical protein ABI409_10100 [Ramlibacter sp.]